MFIIMAKSLTLEVELFSDAKNKHSSLLREFVNYGHKKFHDIGPGSTSLRPPRIPSSFEISAMMRLLTSPDEGLVIKIPSDFFSRCVLGQNVILTGQYQ